MQTALSRHVQGPNKTASEVIEMLRERGCFSFVWGGAVRDCIIGHHPFDIDIATSCEPPAIKQVCRELFGEDRCHSPHKGSEKLAIGRANRNRRELEPIDVANWNTSFRAPSFTKFEYSADTLAYFLGEGWTENLLIDITGHGLEDACARRIKIPTPKSDWNEWAEESFPTKLLRFWKLRAKGFAASTPALHDFVVQKTRNSVSHQKIQQFFCQHVRAGKFHESKCANATGSLAFARHFIRLFNGDVGRNSDVRIDL